MCRYWQQIFSCTWFEAIINIYSIYNIIYTQKYTTNLRILFYPYINTPNHFPITLKKTLTRQQQQNHFNNHNIKKIVQGSSLLIEYMNCYIFSLPPLYLFLFFHNLFFFTFPFRHKQKKSTIIFQKSQRQWKGKNIKSFFCLFFKKRWNDTHFGAFHFKKESEPLPSDI